MSKKKLQGLFNARIHEIENKNDREKALKETIIRIKQNSIDYRTRNNNTDRSCGNDENCRRQAGFGEA